MNILRALSASLFILVLFEPTVATAVCLTAPAHRTEHCQSTATLGTLSVVESTRAPAPACVSMLGCLTAAPTIATSNPDVMVLPSFGFVLPGAGQQLEPGICVAPLTPPPNA